MRAECSPGPLSSLPARQKDDARLTDLIQKWYLEHAFAGVYVLTYSVVSAIKPRHFPDSHSDIANAV